MKDWNSRRRWGLLLLMLLLMLGAVAWLGASSFTAPADGVRSPGAATTPADRTQPVGASAALSRTEVVESAAVPATTAQSDVPTGGSELSGRVIDEATGQGFAEVEVQFLTLPGSTLEGGRVTTDTQGKFVLHFVVKLESGRAAIARITRLQDKRNPIFYGTVILVQDLTILIPPARLLRGRVMDLPIPSLAGCANWNVSCWADGDDAVKKFIGGATLLPDGSFLIETRSRAASSAYLLDLECGTTALACSASDDSMTSPAGAELWIRARQVRVLVQDPGGSALPGSSLCWNATSAPRHAASYCTVDEQGSATIWLASRSTRLVAWSENHGTVATDVLSTADSALLVLRSRDRADSGQAGITGSVVDSAGAPIEGATVSATPLVAGEFGQKCGLAISESGVHGHFRLNVADGAGYRVQAFRGTKGWANLTVSAPATDLLIQLQDAAAIDLDIQADYSGMLSMGGPVRYAFLDNVGHVTLHASEMLPAVVTEVSPDSSRVCVWLDSISCYGEALLSLRAGERQEARVIVEPVHRLQLRVVRNDMPMANVGIIAWSGNWGRRLGQLWGTAMTGEGGFASPFVGVGEFVTLELSYGGRSVKKTVRRDYGGNVVDVTVD